MSSRIFSSSLVIKSFSILMNTEEKFAKQLKSSQSKLHINIKKWWAALSAAAQNLGTEVTLDSHRSDSSKCCPSSSTAANQGFKYDESTLVGCMLKWLMQFHWGSIIIRLASSSCHLSVDLLLLLTCSASEEKSRRKGLMWKIR